MRRPIVFFLLIFLGVLACVMPGVTPPAPIPTFDQNLISTMVIQTAEALGTFQPTPTIAGAPSPAVTIVPVIGESMIMTPPGFELPENVPTGVFIQPAYPKDCPVMNLTREAQMVELINAERANAGVGALIVQARLVHAAQLHSADMACRNYFSHTGLDGSSSGERITRAGYVWTIFGENIAAGYTDPQWIVKDWMKSPSHKSNIINARFTEIGTGYAYHVNSYHAIYWTVVFGAQ